jgi:Uma2 family endonuclease
LLVEVADTSLIYDTKFKSCLYSEAGIHEYWIANVKDEILTLYSHPQRDAYTASRELRRGQTVAPQLLPECVIRVDDLLP